MVCSLNPEAMVCRISIYTHVMTYFLNSSVYKIIENLETLYSQTSYAGSYKPAVEGLILIVLATSIVKTLTSLRDLTCLAKAFHACL